MGRLENNIINQITSLGLDIMYESNEGNVGELFRQSAILYALYAEELMYKNNASNWINRDRVVFSSKRTEALYSTLFLSGFNLTIENLKEFNKLNSDVPFYPDVTKKYGIDSVGGTYNSVGMAVGLCYAQRYIESLISKIKPKNKLFNFNTYLVCSSQDLLNGSACEALSFAGEENLDKLIVLVDANGLENLTSEDIDLKFEAMNFNVFEVKNAQNTDKICDAIEGAKKSKKPSIILIDFKDQIYNLGNITKDNYIDLKTKISVSLEPFAFDEKIKEKYLKNISDRVNKLYQKWLIEYEECRNLNNVNLNMILDLLEQDIFNIEFDDSNFKINDNYFEDLIVSNEKMINVISNKTPFFIGSNLADINKKIISSSEFETKENNLGKNIRFNYRFNACGDILNGIALLNLRPFVYFNGSDLNYLRQSMKISAIANLPVTYIVNCKNEGVYTPIEEINALRMIPNILVLRPSDINEIIGTWEFNLKNRWPMVIDLSNTKMQKYRNTNAKYVKYGAYMIRKEHIRLDGIIVSSGKNIAVAMDVAEELFQDGIDLRVVSMPSMELFLKQNPKYEAQLLPKEIKTFVIDSGEPLLWNRFASNPKCIFAVDKFIKAKDSIELTKENGLDKTTIKRKIKENL